jgi:hypothetical protein
MKKWFALALVAVLAVFAVATVVSAQTPTPPTTPQTPFGRGAMMGGRGQAQTQSGTPQAYGRGMMGAQAGDGWMHDDMVAAFAAKLGLSATDVEARLDKGETMWQIAESKGLTSEQYSAAMLDARNAAIDAAVKAGTFTQAQADAMKQNSQGMPMFQNGFDPEDCPMNGGTTTQQQGGSASSPLERGMMGGRGMMAGRGNR